MIYLDNNATTRVAPEVFEAMRPISQPSGAILRRRTRWAARRARQSEMRARKLPQFLGATDAEEIVFTSCGSESDNWAIGGFLEQNPTRRHIITTRVEHEAVRNLCDHLARLVVK